MIKKLTKSEKNNYQELLCECDPSSYNFTRQLNPYGWLRVLNPRFQLAYDDTGWRGGLKFKQEISIPDKNRLAAEHLLEPMQGASIADLNLETCNVETGWLDRTAVQELGTVDLYETYNTTFGNHEDLEPWEEYPFPQPQHDGYGTPLSEIDELGSKFYTESDMDAPLEVILKQTKAILTEAWKKRHLTKPKRFDQELCAAWVKYNVLALIDFHILCEWYNTPYEFREVFHHFLPSNTSGDVYHEKLAKKLRNELMTTNTLWAIKQSCETLKQPTTAQSDPS